MACIEEEIKQRKFASEYQKLVVNILYTGRYQYQSGLTLP